MSGVLERTVLLLLIAMLVAIVARRFRLPYTVGLVITGIILSATHTGIELNLTHDFILDVILPPLLFEAAINLQWQELRRDMLPVLVLAIGGVVVSAVFIAWGMTYWLAWPWPSSFVFGVLISATDPVAVIALFKDIGVKGRLRLRVEAESLFNDGVAAVLLTLALAASGIGGGTGHTAGVVARAFAVTVGGGLLVGLVAGVFAGFLVSRTTDHLVETALTTVVAYGSFLFAEQLHVSGVLATLMAGLFLGNALLAPPETAISAKGRAFGLDFWEFFAFLANSLIFLLIGLRLAIIPYATLGLSALIMAILLTLFGRALAVYPFCMAFSGSRWAIPFGEQHVLWWGGLRGALGLALALSLPHSVELFDKIAVATFGVVAFSVMVQGLTVPLFLRSR